MVTVVTPEHRTEATRAGRGLHVVLGGDQTASSLAVVACDIPAGVSGPPLHVHPSSDETFIVESGRLLLYADGRVTAVSAGGVVHVSRGTAHSFATPVDTGARFLTIHTPGGFEQFHRAAAQAEQAQGRALAPPELMRVAQDFDWQLAGPPLLPNGQLAGPRP